MAGVQYFGGMSESTYPFMVSGPTRKSMTTGLGALRTPTSINKPIVTRWTAPWQLAKTDLVPWGVTAQAGAGAVKLS
jgi:hypothetical protein